ncbi:MAG: ATP-binding protein, partial [Granulosicoccus sp.]
MRARSWHREYIRSIVDRDVCDVARIKDADDVARLLKQLAIRTGELQNISGLANELKLSNSTVEKYLTVLERLFLIRRLPSWQKHYANRLIKAPKIHLVDSGLSATLAGLDADSWRDDRSRMGHLLESFVVQQVISQVGWTNE